VRDIEEEKRRLENINEKSLRNNLSEKRKRHRTVPKPSSSGSVCNYGGGMERAREQEREPEEE